MAGIPAGKDKAFNVLFKDKVNKKLNCSLFYDNCQSNCNMNSNVCDDKPIMFNSKEKSKRSLHHSHSLEMSLNFTQQEKQLKYLEKKIQVQQSIITNYEKLGYNITLIDKYNHIIKNQIKSQQQYVDLENIILLSDECNSHNLNSSINVILNQLMKML